MLQYNPDTLSARCRCQGAGAESGDRLDVLRLKGAPVETIKLEAEIDAADQLQHPDSFPQTVALGIHPQLAALETCVYPSSSTVQTNLALAAAGTLEIIPAQTPLALFVWGAQRILPVRITEMSVTEDALHPRPESAAGQGLTHPARAHHQRCAPRAPGGGAVHVAPPGNRSSWPAACPASSPTSGSGGCHDLDVAGAGAPAWHRGPRHRATRRQPLRQHDHGHSNAAGRAHGDLSAPALHPGFRQPVTAIWHEVTAADRLDTLAAQYYGDSQLWWRIADANDADDPDELLVLGRRIRITHPEGIAGVPL